MNIDNQTDYWNRVAKEKIFTHPVNTKLLASYIDKSSAILDFGCGYGRVVELLKKDGYTNIKGYDTSKELVNRGNILPIYHIATPENLPVENNSIDCILLFAVLTCIPSNAAQVSLINILRTKLKPGGILYISDYYLQNASTEMSRYGYLNNDQNNYGVFTLPEGVTFRHHTKEWINELISSFSIKEEINIEVRTMNNHVAEAFQMIAMK